MLRCAPQILVTQERGRNLTVDLQIGKDPGVPRLAMGVGAGARLGEGVFGAELVRLAGVEAESDAQAGREADGVAQGGAAGFGVPRLNPPEARVGSLVEMRRRMCPIS